MGAYSLFGCSKSLSFWAGIPGDRCEAVLRLSERKANYDNLK